MSDALCGPSNALQQFQKQSSLDRTLQQDRLISRQSPLQGFRSVDPNAGLLDPEFAAFQASQPSLLPFADSSQLPFHAQQSHRSHATFGASPEQTGWATDFQRLQLSPSQAQAPSSYARPQSAQHSLASHTFQQQPNTSNQSHVASYSNYQPMYQNQNYMGSYGGGLSNASMLQPMPASHSRMIQPQDDMFDEDAFERAFDEAREQMMLEEQDAQAPLNGKEPQGFLTPSDRLEEMAAAKSVQEGLDTQSRSRSDLDIYPYLALLRVRLFQCIAGNSEQATHEAALYVSLLEQHPVENLNTSQLQIFASLFANIHPESMPFESRYALSKRADELNRRYAKELRSRPDAIETPGFQLSQLYFDTLHRLDRTELGMPPTIAVATDVEMRSDVAMRLSDLNKLPIEERVYQAISRENTQPSTTAEPDILEMELSLASALVDQPFQEQLGAQDNWSRLWNITQHVNSMPETVEARDIMESLRQTEPSTVNRMSSMPQTTGYANLESSMLTQSQNDLDMLGQDVSLEQDHVMLNREDPVQEDQTKLDQDRQRNDDDELARTASDLLDKVSDNKTTKFQNSTFLGLMRKLKDREVRVEGDKMVETLQDPDTLAPNPAATMNLTPSLQPGMGSNEAFLHAASEQHQGDGQAVVDLLSQPGLDDQDDDMLMSSPFYGDEHAKISSEGLF